MEIRDISKFTSMMAGIGELYAKPLSAHLIDIYWQALKCFDLVDVQAALQTHINNPDCGQFFPKPADVVRFIEGSGETKALQAWAKVEKAIILVGGYQSIVFDDAIIHAVIEDMGGWIKLCTIKNEDLPFRANEFQKRYMGFISKSPNRHPKTLCGITEIDNAKNGYATDALLLIGDAKKAKQVIESGGGTPLSIQSLSQSVLGLLQKLPGSKAENDDD